MFQLSSAYFTPSPLSSKKKHDDDLLALKGYETQNPQNSFILPEGALFCSSFGGGSDDTLSTAETFKQD